MSYHGTLGKLTDHAQKQVLAAYAAWLDGKLTDDQFTQIVAAILTAANVRASALADVSLAATLAVKLGEPVPTTGNTTGANPERLALAAGTLLAAANTGDDITDRLIRIAVAEPSEAAARTYQQGLGDAKNVDGWVRHLEPDACQLCNWWSRDGQVWPKDHRFPTHKGCQCTPEPIIKKGK